VLGARALARGSHLEVNEQRIDYIKARVGGKRELQDCYRVGNRESGVAKILCGTGFPPASQNSAQWQLQSEFLSWFLSGFL
jgi:hypothetical protein